MREERMRGGALFWQTVGLQAVFRTAACCCFWRMRSRMQRRQHMQPVPASVRRPTSCSEEAEKTSIACSTSWRVTFRQRHKTSFWLTGKIRCRNGNTLGKENRSGKRAGRIQVGRGLNFACLLRLSLNVLCIVSFGAFDVKNFLSSFVEMWREFGCE